MASEQGAGGPIERTLSQLSASGALPSQGEGETLQEPTSKMQQSAQGDDNGQKNVQSSQEFPRRCHASPRATTPGHAALSRHPSISLAASTPATESRSDHLPFPQTWPVEPPVTRATLSELDVSKIIHNPKLRHDINFDPELHFRPNLDGERGRRKQEKANQFWQTLKKELTEFITDRPAFYAEHGNSDGWTLPALLRAVKEIIQTLVPQRDRQFLEEGLNVEFLMQQFHHGIADLEKLALWLSQVLKSHCAPMRDEWVDTMYSQLSRGNRNMDLDELVTGMRSLLSVLEAMKLDVANHQIRCLRPVLIEDTTHFEQRFFYKKMVSRKVDVSQARRWYRDAEQRLTGCPGFTPQCFGDIYIFFDAFSRMILPSEGPRIPSTFLFDEERIQKLRADVLDAINLRVCMQIYEDLVAVGGDFRSVLEYDACSTYRRKESMDTFDFNTPPSSSRPSSLVFSSAGSACSSPRSSFVLPVYEAPNKHTNPANARQFYRSLCALLQSSAPTDPPTVRWQLVAPLMAMEIFRFTNMPSDMVPALEARLSVSLFTSDTPHQQSAEQSFHDALWAELRDRVHEFKSLTGVALFSVATAGCVSSGRRNRRSDPLLGVAHDEPVIHDAATRLAHIGVLHWRVWAELAYAHDSEHLLVSDEPMQI